MKQIELSELAAHAADIAGGQSAIIAQNGRPPFAAVPIAQAQQREADAEAMQRAQSLEDEYRTHPRRFVPLARFVERDEQLTREGR